MRKLYELRCGIVHGGGKKPSLNDVKILFNYVRRAIEHGLSETSVKEGASSKAG